MSVAIGIDLGTTFSCVAFYDKRNNRVEVIPNDQGDRTTPSVVAFTENERLVGKAARENAIMDTKNTLYGVKRLIGRTYHEAQQQQDQLNWPFVISESGTGVKIHAEYKGEEKLFAPEEISAMVLEKMKQTAERHLQGANKKIEGAVITVPAYFSDAQRQATKDAAAIAGLNVLRIINEPTAAAIAYGLNSEDPEERNILVFDLGGGTFDVSILHIEEGVFEVKSTAGDTTLGGEDFTNRLVAHCVNTFPKEERSALVGNQRAIGRLRQECEKAKINLAGTTTVTIDVQSLYQGQDFKTPVTRAKFDDLNKDLFKKIVEIVGMAIADAGMDKSDIDEVIMVGGSSRIIKISQMMTEYFGEGSRINKTINPDEAVAVGAAHQAYKLSGGDVCTALQEYVLIDVTPLSLGINNNKDQMSIVIDKNTQVPTTRKKAYKTNRINQKTMEIKIYEGERLIAKHNNLLGIFTLDNLPQLNKILDVEVSFELDSDGILKVSALETSQDVSQSVRILDNKGRLSTHEIRRMIEDAERYRADDEREIERIDAKVALEHRCYQIQSNVKKMEIKTLKTADILKECNNILNWIDDNPNAAKDAFIMKENILNVKFQQID